jgi:5-methylcytosine-specific restriction endonuclease McrA
MVHHIIPRKERPDLELVMDNLRSLCATCHEEHHPERRAKAKRKTEAQRAPAGGHRMRVIKV